MYSLYLLIIVHLEIQLSDNIFYSVDPPSEEIRKLQVTMVGWNRTDEYVITASSDKLLRVWDSKTGQLKQILRGHEDNSYVIEAHPFESRLILTGAHDGKAYFN